MAAADVHAPGFTMGTKVKASMALTMRLEKTWRISPLEAVEAEGRARGRGCR